MNTGPLAQSAIPLSYGHTAPTMSLAAPSPLGWTAYTQAERECYAIDVAGRIRSARVIEVLSQVMSVQGAPQYLRSDNGPEFVSRAILDNVPMIVGI
jgi:hypothetical protein